MKRFKVELGKIVYAKDLFVLYDAFGVDFDKERIKDISQIHASDETILTMQKIIENGFDKKYKKYNPKYKAYSVGMHMLEFAPKTDNDIPYNELWVYESNEGY